jgi:hypothetical protein
MQLSTLVNVLAFLASWLMKMNA